MTENASPEGGKTQTPDMIFNQNKSKPETNKTKGTLVNGPVHVPN